MTIDELREMGAKGFRMVGHSSTALTHHGREYTYHFEREVEQSSGPGVRPPGHWSGDIDDPLPEGPAVPFGTLTPGALFRLPHGTRLFVRLGNLLNFNAARLEGGDVHQFEDERLVYVKSHGEPSEPVQPEPRVPFGDLSEGTKFYIDRHPGKALCIKSDHWRGLSAGNSTYYNTISLANGESLKLLTDDLVELA
jgi:hypothetical protein